MAGFIAGVGKVLKNRAKNDVQAVKDRAAGKTRGGGGSTVKMDDITQPSRDDYDDSSGRTNKKRSNGKSR